MLGLARGMFPSSLEFHFRRCLLQTFAVVFRNFCRGVQKQLPWCSQTFAVMFSNFCRQNFCCDIHKLSFTVILVGHRKTFAVVFTNYCRDVQKLLPWCSQTFAVILVGHRNKKPRQTRILMFKIFFTREKKKKKKKKSPLRGFSLRRYAVTRYAVTRFTNNRQLVAKLRSGNHDLRIETGRHCIPKVPKHLRICKFCSDNEVENESHFLFSCNLYQNIRKKFFDDVSLKYPNFKFICKKLRYFTFGAFQKRKQWSHLS